MRQLLSDKQMEAKSRPTVIALCVLTLRLMENWRSVIREVDLDPSDSDTTMIVMAVVAIGAEKFIRGELEPELHNLKAVMPAGRLNAPNVSSIAAATGINRETVRRKVSHLIKAGLLEREEGGGLRVPASFAVREELRSVIRAQVDALERTVNQLRVIGGLRGA
ncbi:GntR family transcriptional regulator [Sphingomonas piscis]|nr:GntR family transcriptional regulator [Sphingomonas piscis]